MTNSTHSPSRSGRRPTNSRGFEDSEGLRALLHRLADAGEGAWQRDPEVTALMRHAADKYAALARKHGLDPWEAATAAFHAMRKPNARTADDPWAVITHAVRITCIAEERGNGLLCSTDRARRAEYSVFHDPERFSDRENPLTDYHPAFHTHTAFDTDDEDGDDLGAAGNGGGRGGGAGTTAGDGDGGVGSAVEDAIGLLCLLGWDPSLARASVETVCARLSRSSSRAGAFEALRRDKYARALLDLPASSWTGLLRVLLGHPDHAHTSAGRGVLLRLLVGEPLRALLLDGDLVVAVTLAAPPRTGQRP